MDKKSIAKEAYLAAIKSLGLPEMIVSEHKWTEAFEEWWKEFDDKLLEKEQRGLESEEDIEYEETKAFLRNHGIRSAF